MIRKNIMLFILILLPSTFYGQFESGKHIIGPTLGFSFLGSTIQFGLNHEYGINLNEIGLAERGHIGIGGVFRYWTYTENFINVKTDYSDILLGIQSNYHFYIMDERIDPFIGLTIAHDFGSYDQEIKVSDVNIDEPSSNSLFIGAQAGLRYWIEDNMAINFRIGFGTLSYGALDLGFDYKFN